MKLSNTQIQTDAVTAGAPGALLPLAALCCLVVAIIGMGLKFPWFRRQMRLGSMAQATATDSENRELTARVTNVPTQGVFRQWVSQDEGPPPAPPPPPRKEKGRPKSVAPQPPTNRSSSPPEPPPVVKSKAKAVSVPVPPPIKSKSAPPSRRNPNAPAFALSSAATNSAQPIAAKRTTAPPSASNPILASSADHDEEVPSFHLLNIPVNGHVGNAVSKSPKPTSKKAPKVMKSKNKAKKTPSFARMVPPPTVPPPKMASPKAFSSDSENEGDGTLTFRLPDAPQPFDEVHPSFLAGGVADSDECDA